MVAEKTRTLNKVGSIRRIIIRKIVMVSSDFRLNKIYRGLKQIYSYYYFSSKFEKKNPGSNIKFISYIPSRLYSTILNIFTIGAMQVVKISTKEKY